VPKTISSFELTLNHRRPHQALTQWPSKGAHSYAHLEKSTLGPTAPAPWGRALPLEPDLTYLIYTICGMDIARSPWGWKEARIMKNLPCLLALVLLTWIPGRCQETAAQQQKNGEHETASQQRDRYEAKAEARLRELKRHIDDLNTKASKQGGEARKGLDRQVTQLDRERVAVQKQLDKLKTSSQQAWRDMKPDLEAAMKNLEAAYQHAAADYKK
jgi:hypothetical protein